MSQVAVTPISPYYSVQGGTAAIYVVFVAVVASAGQWQHHAEPFACTQPITPRMRLDRLQEPFFKPSV